MTWLTVLLTLAGIALLLGICIFTVRMEKKFPEKRYDERQRELVNRGYRFGFWCGIGAQFITMVIVTLLDDGAGFNSDVIPTVLAASLLLPLLACLTYNAVQGVLVSRQDSALGSAIGFSLMSIAQFASAWESMAAGRIRFYPTLIFGVGMLYIAALYFIAYLRERK